LRSSAVSEGSLWEVELARAETAQSFGLLGSLPREFGRSGYWAVMTFLGSMVGKVHLSSPWVCHWLALAFLSCAQQCCQTEE